MQPISFAKMPSAYTVNRIENGYDRSQRGQGQERFVNEQEIDKRKQLYEAYNNAVTVANLKDQQLLDIAKQDASRDDKYKFGTYAAALVGVPVVDTLLRGTLTSGKLATRVGAMGKTAAGWAGVFALAGLYNGVYDKVTAVAPVLKKNEDRHPVISSLLRLAGFAAVIIGAQKGISKLATVLPKKMPGVASDLSKIKSGLAEKINNSVVNTKVLSPIKEKVVNFANKHPKTTGFAVSTAIMSVPFMAFGALFKAFSDRNEKAEKVRDNYNRLVEQRALNRAKVDYVNAKIMAEQINNALAQANYVGSTLNHVM